MPTLADFAPIDALFVHSDCSPESRCVDESRCADLLRSIGQRIGEPVPGSDFEVCSAYCLDVFGTTLLPS